MEHIFRGLMLSEDALGDALYQAAITMNQFFKGGIIVVLDKAFEQIAIAGGVVR